MVPFSSEFFVDCGLIFKCEVYDEYLTNPLRPLSKATFRLAPRPWVHTIHAPSAPYTANLGPDNGEKLSILKTDMPVNLKRKAKGVDSETRAIEILL